MDDFLNKVVKTKLHEVKSLKRSKSLKQALSRGSCVIAEIKRRSPAKGDLNPILDPVKLAHDYHQAGANVISVLTDQTHFKGSIHDLHQVSQSLHDTQAVILRKDFIIDPLQLIESARAGADAVLLIVSILQGRTQDFLNRARGLNLEVLLEVHTKDELMLALETDAEIIGINHRNLKTLEIDLSLSTQLKPMIPDHRLCVAESGILEAEQALALFNQGYQGILVGEALVRSSNPAQLIRDFRGESR